MAGGKEGSLHGGSQSKGAHGWAGVGKALEGDIRVAYDSAGGGGGAKPPQNGAEVSVYPVLLGPHHSVLLCLHQEGQYEEGHHDTMIGLCSGLRGEASLQLSTHFLSIEIQYNLCSSDWPRPLQTQ